MGGGMSARKGDACGFQASSNVIGEGAYAKVVLGWEKKTCTPVAIKMISKKTSNRTDVESEIAIMKEVQNHPHILELLGHYETATDICLVLQHMAGGELFDRLLWEGPYSERTARKHLKDIAEALSYMHSKNIIHRDLKPENLLLTTNDKKGILKIADFGLASSLKENETLSSPCGTWVYCAPEVLQLQRDKRCMKGYDTKADMWSFGVIMYILLSGRHPFDVYLQKSNREICSGIIAGDFDFTFKSWSMISDEAKDLISKLLVVDPQARFCANQCLQHPWLSGVSEVSNKPIKDIDHRLGQVRHALRRKLRASFLAGVATSHLLIGQATRRASLLQAEVEASKDAVGNNRTDDNECLANSEENRPGARDGVDDDAKTDVETSTDVTTSISISQEVVDASSNGEGCCNDKTELEPAPSAEARMAETSQ